MNEQNISRGKLVAFLSEWIMQTEYFSYPKQQEILDNINNYSNEELMELWKLYKKTRKKSKTSFSTKKLIIFSVFTALILISFFTVKFFKNKKIENWKNAYVAMFCLEENIRQNKELQTPKNLTEATVEEKKILTDNNFKDFNDFYKALDYLSESQQMEIISDVEVMKQEQCGELMENIEVEDYNWQNFRLEEY